MEKLSPTMASMQGRFRPSHKPKPHMLAVPLCAMSTIQMRKYLIFIFTLTIFSCSGTKNLADLSELTIENRPSSKLIVDGKPDYGIDGRDGCVVMGEISMDISELSEKSISGRVFDSKTKEPLINAKLTLFLNKNGSTEKMVIVSNSDGYYNTKQNGLLEKIEVEYVAYRNLIIDLEKP